MSKIWWPLRALLAGLISVFLGWEAYNTFHGWPSWPMLGIIAVVVVWLGWSFENRWNTVVVFAILAVVGLGLGWGWFNNWFGKQAWHLVVTGMVLAALGLTVIAISRQLLGGKRKK